MSNFSVVIPALKEKNNIEKLIQEIYKVIKTSSNNFEIICVIGKDEEIVIKNNYENLHIIKRQNKNFSSALTQGIRYAKNNFIISMDSDGSHSFLEINRYVDYFVDNNLDVLIFSRNCEGAKNYENIFNVALSRFLNYFLRIFSGLKLTDYTNNLRIFKKSILSEEPYTSKHFEFLYEFLIIAKQNFPELKILEVPTNHLKRTKGRSKKNHINYIMKFIFLIIKIKFRKL